MPSIRHTVAVALPFPEGSDEEAAFLRSAQRLVPQGTDVRAGTS